jgi:hypothetical protein
MSRKKLAVHSLAPSCKNHKWLISNSVAKSCSIRTAVHEQETSEIVHVTEKEQSNYSEQ